jgi:hypothetical protein
MVVRRKRGADSQRGVMDFAAIIGFTAGGMTAVVAIGRVLIGYALSD